MLSTLLKPTAGHARVADHDVQGDKLAVRRRIGVVFQELALDRTLTVSQNLQFAGRLNGMTAADIKVRAAELLEIFDLTGKLHAPVAALSGGMRRALDIARGLIHQPQILFLDEPTSGLDLPSRRAIWRHIAQLRAARGVTVFLTTHYLEEAADCDDVAFLSAGQIKLRGSPRDLVGNLGKYVLEIETDKPEEMRVKLMPQLNDPIVEPDRLQYLCNQEPADLLALQADIAASVRAVRWRRPTLNDVFLWVNRPSAAHRKAA